MLFVQKILSLISRQASARADTRPALLVCFLCIVALSASRSALADFVGLTATHKADLPICQDTENEYIDVPLTVCNVFAGFDDPLDELSLVQSADIQVFDGPNPDVFFQHDIGNLRYPPCSLIELLTRVIAVISTPSAISTWPTMPTPPAIMQSLPTRVLPAIAVQPAIAVCAPMCTL